MEWLLGTRVGIVPVASNSVNDAILKGVVSKIDKLGFEIEPDKNPSLPVTYTWQSMRNFKFIALAKSGGRKLNE